MKTRSMNVKLRWYLFNHDWEEIKKYIAHNEKRPENFDGCDGDGKTLFARLFDADLHTLLQKLIDCNGAIDAETLNNEPVKAAKFIVSLFERSCNNTVNKIFNCSTFNVNIFDDDEPLLFTTLRYGDRDTLAAILRHPLLNPTLRSVSNTVWTLAVNVGSKPKIELLAADKRFHPLVNDVDA